MLRLVLFGGWGGLTFWGMCAIIKVSLDVALFVASRKIFIKLYIERKDVCLKKIQRMA